MKRFLFLILMTITIIITSITGCNSGSDNLNMMSIPSFTSSIEGYVFKEGTTSSSAPNKATTLLQPASTESVLSGVVVSIYGTSISTTSDSTGYFKLEITDRDYLGIRKITFKSPSGTSEYGNVVLNINENDRKLYRVKLNTVNKNNEVIEFNPDDKTTIINRFPLVDAGPDIYTNNFTNDYIKIITENSYDPDGDISTVKLDLNNDMVFERIEPYRSRYIISDRQHYFTNPGTYVVNVLMMDDMGGVALDSMNVYVQTNNRMTNFKPVAYITEGDAAQDGIIEANGGTQLKITGYGRDYDDLPGISLTYKWTQVSGPSVSMSFSSDTTEMTFTPVSGNDYVFNFYANDGTYESEPAQITVKCDSSSTGGTNTGSSEGYLYYEAENIIYRLNTQAISETALTGSTYISTYPCLTSDGSTLYFSSNKSDSENYDIYTIPNTGGTVVRVNNTQSTTNINKDEFMPFVSSDDKIYFVYNSSLNSMDITGSNIKQQIDFNGKMVKFPTVSKDRDKLVLCSNRDTVNSFELFLYDLDSSGDVIETSEVQLTTGNNDFYPSFSKDGSFIVFYRENSSGNGDIMKLDVATKNLVSLTSDSFDNAYPIISSDDSKIYFTSNRDNDMGEIYYMTITGSSITRLTDNLYKERFLVFGE